MTKSKRTAPAAGPSSSTPPSEPWTATTRQLAGSLPRIRALAVSSGRSRKHYLRDESLAQQKADTGRSKLEAQYALLLRVFGLPMPHREYRFAAAVVGDSRGVRDRLAAAGYKNWRFDFAWPDQKLAVEIEGGVWTGGRHTRGSGFIDDCVKYNAAQLIGWTVLRFVGEHLEDGSAIALTARGLGFELMQDKGPRRLGESDEL